MSYLLCGIAIALLLACYLKLQKSQGSLKALQSKFDTYKAEHSQPPEPVVVEKTIEVPVEVEKVVEIPVEVEKIVEVPVEVEKIVQVPVEVEKAVEKVIYAEDRVEYYRNPFSERLLDNIPSFREERQQQWNDGNQYAILSPDKKLKSFAAIDFEHLTPNHHTACAVGVVIVIDGQIVQTFYTLIQPLSDERKTLNTHVHGITEEMCKNAPDFIETYAILEYLIGNLPMVAHHAATERAVLQKACSKCKMGNLSYLGNECFIDTYRYTNKSLKESCEQYGIPLGEHHNAYDDALACARLYMKLQGKEISAPKPKERLIHRTNIDVSFLKDYSRGKDKSFFGKYIEEEQIEIPGTYFHGKEICCTGFAANEANKVNYQLYKLGAMIRGSVTKHLNVLILGPTGEDSTSKIAEAKERGIPIIPLEKFRDMMNEIGIKI